ncbi:antibiotic biosynthesis monooxygenase [Thalassolituus maritimus]|jgi:heme-degrading monooxygenase HmoA|uniref:ABM domain-containing protein n=1 Tax=Thalassolituus maritimus TaxID=484498 RepID=A0ABP9ZZI6_9GAMM|nr:antibiotic biosynthesis monooxygenase [Pseudomonadota bacterium]MEC8104886.1 antibiotic biosynthesis monooxygenase [Pseudomonadota bacterium]MEC8523118.1 antibiotic biosynthesis monooxygenase [Pseudomonadota bacterium]
MIKVIIEREIADDMESTYEAAVKNTLRAILEAPGYVSGASYKDVKNDNRRMIITNWVDVKSWQSWAKSNERADVIASIQPILNQQEKITILTA